MNLEIPKSFCATSPDCIDLSESILVKGGVQTTITRWDFQCGDGWMELVYSLSRAITDHAQRAGLDILAVQVKEKFGTLRFYVYGGEPSSIGQARQPRESTGRLRPEAGIQRSSHSPEQFSSAFNLWHFAKALPLVDIHQKCCDKIWKYLG